jgi:hypothetical protein
MAITYPLTLPATFRRASWRISGRSSAAVIPSPFTFEEEVQVWPGQGWRVELAVPPQPEAYARAWCAWGLSLNGREGTFLMGDPSRPAPRGVGTGTPLVNGAGQTGQTLVTDGWTASQTGILKAGDLIQLGSGSTAYLHMILADANSDSGGNATLDIWPRLRASPSDNATITTVQPKGRFRLVSNEWAWSVQAGQLYGFTIECAEALP